MGMGPGNLGGQLGIYANAVTRCGLDTRQATERPYTNRRCIGAAICWRQAQQLVEESEGPMSGQFVSLDSSRALLLDLQS
jgi:hypothetical protein